MPNWQVRDRAGHELYMTEERWQHITSKHFELIGHLDDVLDTLRRRKRRQERRDPQRYRYQRASYALRNGNNQIVVAVVFSFRKLDDGSTISNNFVSTAWSEYVPR